MSQTPTISERQNAAQHTQTLFAWAAKASDAVTLTSLSITAAREGGVAADASFGGSS
jgi:hypothetical protein